MNTNDNRRAAARSRANRRLQRMTIGTAMLGVVATGGLGWLAAVTYNGSTALGATAIVRTDDEGGSAATPASSSTATGTSSSPAVASVQGGAHVSTGGS